MIIDDWVHRTGLAWADEWRRTDRGFSGLMPALDAAILAAMPMAGRLVDVGCGAGSTSLAVAAARPAAEVVGLDLSPALVAKARERGAAVGNCRFVEGDARTAVGAIAPVDGFFSRHGVMFFIDPTAAFAALAAAAAPGARLVFSCFTAAADNDWATRTAATVGAAPTPPADGPPPPGPFAFADPAYVRSILTAAGWSATDPEHVAFSYVGGAGEDAVADAVAFLGRIGPAAAALAAASASERPALVDRLAALCADHREGNEVAFPASAWIWSAQLQERAR